MPRTPNLSNICPVRGRRVRKMWSLHWTRQAILAWPASQWWSSAALLPPLQLPQSLLAHPHSNGLLSRDPGPSCWESRDWKRGHYEKGLFTGVITKRVFSLEESLESLNSLESQEKGRSLLYFPVFGDSLKSLESLDSLESLENGLVWKDPFSKRPFFRAVPSAGLSCCWKGISVTGAFEPCFKGIWGSDFLYVLRMDEP